VFLNSSYDSGEDVLVKVNESTWGTLSNYNEDLTHKLYSELDIIKVEKCPVYELTNTQPKNLSLLWQRDRVKEMTIAEIEELVGCKVKIVKGDNND